MTGPVRVPLLGPWLDSLLGRRLGRRLVLGLSGLGLVLTAVSAGVDLSDSAPRAQLWLGTAAGAVFVAAVPLVRDGEVQALATRARLLIGAGVAAVLAVFGLFQATEPTEPRVLLLLVPAALLFVAAAIGIREASRLRSAVSLGKLRARLDGQEIERRRWARELHDGTLQDLAAIELRLAALEAGLGSGLDAGPGSPERRAVVESLDATRAMTRDQIRSLRHLITQMRPLALDALGLTAALQDLADRAADSGDVRVRSELGVLPEGLGPDVEASVYRIVQEAVTNALKHAHARAISLTAVTTSETLELTVADDGVGMGEAATDSGSGGAGLGRVGMQERARAVDADLTWRPAPGGGTEVVLRLPLRRR